MRLRRSRPGGPGITRRRCGRGFRYTDADGEPLTDPDTLERIKSLAIPPAWRRVWICEYPHGHIQAIGYDAAGRRQYLYHEQWRRERDEEKHDRVLALAHRLPRFRDAVAADLSRRGVDRDRVLALALRILDRCGLRTGNEEYLTDNGSIGLTTLADRHAELRGSTLTLCFPAKSGVRCDVEFRDAAVARAVKALRRAEKPRRRFLSYRDRRGWHDVQTEDVNQRFKQHTGDEFTAKDLRTWHATVTAAVAFARLEPPASKTATRRAVTAVMRQVATELGNTPPVAKQSYVDPRVIAAFEHGRTIAAALRRAERHADEDSRQLARDRAVARLISTEDRR